MWRLRLKIALNIQGKCCLLKGFGRFCALRGVRLAQEMGVTGSEIALPFRYRSRGRFGNAHRATAAAPKSETPEPRFPHRM